MKAVAWSVSGRVTTVSGSMRAFASRRLGSRIATSTGHNRMSLEKCWLRRYFGDCHDDLKRVIAEASDGLRPWAFSMLPVGFRWSPRPGVTLLGDAAHLMTPFAGVGINVALADALGLAKALLKRKDALEADLSGNLAEALQEYERPMFERAKENMEKTRVGLQMHFSADGIDDRVHKLRRAAKQRGVSK